MKKTSKPQSTLPARSLTKVCEQKIYYRLLRIQTENDSNYRICIRFRKESISLPIPAQSIEQAEIIYTSIVNGKVTPCTLHDVLQDLTSS